MKSFLNYFQGKSSDKQNYFSIKDLPSPVWTEQKYEPLVKEGYQHNSLVYRIINMIAHNASMIKINFTTTSQNNKPLTEPIYDEQMVAVEGQRKDGHNDSSTETYVTKPLAEIDLGNVSNSVLTFFTKTSTIEKIVHYLMLSGNAYLHLHVLDNKPHSVTILRPDRVKIIANHHQSTVAGYEYWINGSCTFVSKEHILHLKKFNPLNDWYGFSPLETIYRAIDQYRAVDIHNLSLLQNGGRPSGALIIKPSTFQLNEEQRSYIRKQVEKLYSGSHNAGKIMLLEGDLEWKDLGLSPKDLDFSTAKEFAAQEIAQAYGVPIILIGYRNAHQSMYAYKEARTQFIEETILPLMTYIAEELEAWLQPFFHNLSVSVKKGDRTC